jgi:hypothetical protein
MFMHGMQREHWLFRVPGSGGGKWTRKISCYCEEQCKERPGASEICDQIMNTRKEWDLTQHEVGDDCESRSGNPANQACFVGRATCYIIEHESKAKDLSKDVQLH